jgi:hypothetical protein
LALAAFLGGLASSIGKPKLADGIALCVFAALLALILIRFVTTPQGLQPCMNL